jgi:chloramphenicol-sensitive protein RarD
MNRGILYALGAFSLWGFMPVYLKSISQVPATQILAHRIFWAFVLLAVLVAARRELPALRASLDRRTMIVQTAAAFLIGANWLTYITGVNTGHVIETSLGYYINPMVSVLLGTLILRERLRPLQWLPVGLAAAGVLYLTLSYGKPPYFALILAFTFGFYGLMKRITPIRPLHGMAVETGIMVMPALLFLIFHQAQGSGAFTRMGLTNDLLLMASGLITVVPLLLFSAAAQRINLATLGLMQYFAPTTQFLIGWLVYKEPFTQTSLIGFSLIWIALFIYTVEGLSVRRRSQLPA